MKQPLVAIVSFPGNNCEVESLRALKESGIQAMFFRWNDDRAKLKDVDGYFIPGGFSYEDRGRSGMVAARDPLLTFLAGEAAAGKTIIGNCNGAQILVESGLIPLDRGLRMGLAHNAVQTESGYDSVGFLNEWVWITPACKRDRCATSDWTGAMHVPIAHGEGRFTTSDKDVIAELRKNNQIAFQYCDEAGRVSEDPIVTPNGAMFAIAGICNPAGNVVALMPHPERTSNGKPYFDSLQSWLQAKRTDVPNHQYDERSTTGRSLPQASAQSEEIFIEMIITNNEERTVEQAIHRIVPSMKLKQWKYIALKKKKAEDLLMDIAIFNSNKERAVIRRAGVWHSWDSTKKKMQLLDRDPLQGITLVRRELVGSGNSEFQLGVAYTLRNTDEAELKRQELLEIFANPHASTLERLPS